MPAAAPYLDGLNPEQRRAVDHGATGTGPFALAHLVRDTNELVRDTNDLVRDTNYLVGATYHLVGVTNYLVGVTY